MTSRSCPRVAASSGNTVLDIDDVFDLLPDAVVVVDSNDRIVCANSAIHGLLGYTRDELLARPLGVLIPPRCRNEHAHHVTRFRKTGRKMPMSERPVLPALHRSGEEVPVSISLANFEVAGERFSVALIRDASPLSDQLVKALATAESDALTGLGNRLCLSRRIQGLLQSERNFGLLFLDLTRFKPFNDHYGHATGDAVLRLIGKRLNALVRSNDLAVRLGGDEFVILFDGLAEIDDLGSRAAGVIESLTQPFHLPELSATIGVNVGGVLYPRDGSSEKDLLAVADRNMYRAKRAGVLCCTDAADC